MKLNETQIKLLAETFFVLDHTPGWRNIAEFLLRDGSCIIAGDVSPWHGGVGNFIKREPARGAVACSLLSFDLEVFLKASWVQSTLSQKEFDTNTKIHELEDTLGSIINLLR